MLSETMLLYNGTVVSFSLATYVVFDIQRGYISQWGKSLSLLTGLVHVVALSITIITTFLGVSSALSEMISACILFIDSIGLGFFEYILLGLLLTEHGRARIPAVYPRPRD